MASDREARLLELRAFEERLAAKSSKLEPAGRDKENEERKILSLEREGHEKRWVGVRGLEKPLPLMIGDLSL